MARQIVIIGGGPAGIEAAKAAARAGAKVTLVSDAPLGGRAGWHSLLPSKVWLTAADTLGLFSKAGELGLIIDGAAEASPDAILKRIKQVKQRWNQQQEATLQQCGVEIVTGVGAFQSPREVVVKNADGEIVKRFQPDAAIIAAGSVPFFPPGLRPDGNRVLAPRFASHLNWLPKTVAVIGAGATGSEFAYLFNRLGADVTWVVNASGVLPDFQPAAGKFLADAMAKRGAKIIAGQPAERIERDDDGVTVVTTDGTQIRAEMAFVAVGRLADVSRLNLEAAGLAVEPGKAPAVDQFCRTAAPDIYAIGDAAGSPMVANRATAQARVAGIHAAGGGTAPFREETVINAIFTEPQVAQAGAMAGENIDTVRVPFAESMKAHLIPEGEGFVELAFNSDGLITGGLAVGPHAADVLAPVALAIQLEASVQDLAALFAAHPTLSELAFAAAREA